MRKNTNSKIDGGNVVILMPLFGGGSCQSTLPTNFPWLKVRHTSILGGVDSAYSTALATSSASSACSEEEYSHSREKISCRCFAHCSIWIECVVFFNRLLNIFSFIKSRSKLSLRRSRRNRLFGKQYTACVLRQI